MSNPDILVWLRYEASDGGKVDAVRLPAVPRVGKDFYYNRQGHNTRYVICQVNQDCN